MDGYWNIGILGYWDIGILGLGYLKGAMAMLPKWSAAVPRQGKVGRQASLAGDLPRQRPAVSRLQLRPGFD